MKNDQNKKIEDILGSLDGSQRATVPDFFYTRLQARMLAQLDGGKVPALKKSWILRPAYALAVLAGVLVINAAVILKGNTTENGVTNSNDTETLQSIAAEYSLNDNNSVYDLTQEP
ncbi:MAG: hypothetical protein H7Y01_14920 [Ferruginibacter sp.]|nr:hypothetical protein [Chitinophagaceae bacterium]